MRISTAGNSTRAKGFTLVELCVVLLLIGLFSALLLPQLDRVGQGELDATARRLRGTIRFVFNEAALTGREHRLTCDLDRGTYRAMALKPGGELTELAGPGREARLPAGIRFQDLMLRGRGTFSAGEISLRIHPTGWLEETVIHLQDQGGAQRTLRIAAVGGVTDIYQGYKVF